MDMRKDFPKNGIRSAQTLIGISSTKMRDVSSALLRSVAVGCDICLSVTELRDSFSN